MSGLIEVSLPFSRDIFELINEYARYKHEDALFEMIAEAEHSYPIVNLPEYAGGHWIYSYECTRDEWTVSISLDEEDEDSSSDKIEADSSAFQICVRDSNGHTIDDYTPFELANYINQHLGERATWSIESARAQDRPELNCITPSWEDGLYFDLQDWICAHTQILIKSDENDAEMQKM